VKKEIIPKDASDKFIQFIPIINGALKRVSPSVFPYVYSQKIIPVFTPITSTINPKRNNCKQRKIKLLE
jgi:hypothetical protein